MEPIKTGKTDKQTNLRLQNGISSEKCKDNLIFMQEESGRNQLIFSRNNSIGEEELLETHFCCQQKHQARRKNYFCHLFFIPSTWGFRVPMSACYQCSLPFYRFSQVMDTKRKFTWHALIHEWIGLKCSFTSRDKSTFSWMLCPFLQRLNFLSLNVSIKIVLITLNICLK